MNSANLTREETAARSAAVTVHEIRVELDVTSAPDADAVGFSTITTLHFDARSDSTWLDFIGVAVLRVSVNGVDRDVEWDGARLFLTGLSAENLVVVEAVGAYSRSGEGMHRFVDPVDGETYLYTQYEPADSRRVMACFEQPDMKAAYTFVVTAPRGWHVLSNQRAVERRDRGASETIEFAPTLPLSSYITSVVAGPYARVDDVWAKGEQRVELGVLCRTSLLPSLDHEEIFEITKQGLSFFDEAFAYPYPWGKYDQIFVPEYNLGAMENPGLVTFTEGYVFRGASTVSQHEARANTILHEMAHMWFGDLVTMTWWDDLWLKESFADYMGAHASAAATKFAEAWTTFANRRKAWAYAQDQLPTTHPIVADIVDLEAAKLNFDGITYAKGAAVLKQLVAFVGEDAFFEGARRYFRTHAFGNTTLDDLLRALEETSGRDLRAWSAAWLETSGMSTLRLERNGDGTVTLSQEDPRPHRLRLGYFAFDGGVLTRVGEQDLDFVESKVTCDVPDVDLILLNDGDLSYAKARLDERSLDAVERGLSSIEETLARGLIWASLWNAVRDGELPVLRYLGIVTAHAPSESSASLLTSVVTNAAFAIENYLPTSRRAGARRDWLETSWTNMFGAPASSDAQLLWARAFAAAAHHDPHRAEAIRAMLDNDALAPRGLALDADMRWLLLTALASTGAIDPAEVEAEYARDATSNGATARIRALAARPLPEVKRASWHSAWNDNSLSNDHLDATIGGFLAGGRRDLTAEFDSSYFAQIRDVWTTRSIEIAGRLVTGLFPKGDSTDDVDSWLLAHSDAPRALIRLVVEQRDHLARALRVRAAQE